MPIIPVGEKYALYGYTANKTYVPLEGQIVYLTAVESFIENIVSVIGNGSSQIQNLPFRETIIIKTSVNISLENLRINENKALIQNTGITNILINVGTTGSPKWLSIESGLMILFKYDGTNWIALSLNEQLKKTVDYTITDGEIYKSYHLDTTGGQYIIITLPQLSNNQNKLPYKIINTGTGIVRILCFGSETINGFSEVRLYSQNDFIEIIPTSTEWKIINQNVNIDSGRINTNDWTTRSLGLCVINYDNKTAGNPKLGGYIKGATSNTSGKIINYDGPTLVLINVDNGGIFLNNETINGLGFTFTALVNEPTGNNKNKDTNIFIYSMGNKNHKLDKKFIIYLSDDDGNYIEPSEIALALLGSTDAYGNSYFFINVDAIDMRTAAQGLAYINYGGTRTILEAQDYYYRHIIKINY